MLVTHDEQWNLSHDIIVVYEPPVCCSDSFHKGSGIKMALGGVMREIGKVRTIPKRIELHKITSLLGNDQEILLDFLFASR